jgi:lipopolysaccharide transport system ATP-binding protein
MSNTVIKVENLGKQYHLGKVGTGTIANDLKRWWHIARGKEDPYLKIGDVNDRTQKSSNNDVVWAIKDINFEVKQGEVLGIIGKNGAGKSTLLKILSRVTAPTVGDIKVKGRIASLLEVGTGFHPELSGRENIFLNGAILGMTKAEIKTKFDEIVEFSGVERYIDTPVKRYSSGMYVRLAFAVAAHLDSEILILDEVLAVGDAEFQKKCLGKMQDVSKNEGRTVLFVSHNMQAISTLTTRAVFLKNGKMAGEGLSAGMIQLYLEDNIQKELRYNGKILSDKPSITSVCIVTSEPGNVHIHGKPLQIKFTINTPYPIDNSALSFQIVNLRDVSVVHAWTFDSDRPMLRNAGEEEIVCIIPRTRLYMGKYILNVHFARSFGAEKFETLLGICPFEIVMYGMDREYKWVPDTCVYMEESEWIINKRRT